MFLLDLEEEKCRVQERPVPTGKQTRGSNTLETPKEATKPTATVYPSLGTRIHFTHESKNTKPLTLQNSPTPPKQYNKEMIAPEETTSTTPSSDLSHILVIRTARGSKSLNTKHKEKRSADGASPQIPRFPSDARDSPKKCTRIAL